jgi:hypothetical protein
MKGKFILLAGAAIGYVAGTAAGRQRFEQMKSQARRAANNPKVQEAATEAKHKVAEAATTVAHAAADKVHRNGDTDPLSVEPESPAYDTTTPTGSPIP